MTNAAITLMFFSNNEILLMLHTDITYILIQQKFVFIDMHDDSYTVHVIRFKCDILVIDMIIIMIKYILYKHTHHKEPLLRPYS